MIKTNKFNSDVLFIKLQEKGLMITMYLRSYHQLNMMKMWQLIQTIKNKNIK